MLATPSTCKPSKISPSLNFCLHKQQKMASTTGSLVSILSFPGLATTKVFGMKKALPFVSQGGSFLSFTSKPVPARLHISCAAKPETVDKVCGIVKKQLALPDETAVTGDSKFAELGADSLDTVEIVMGIEEEFGISVEEESAQSIATVQDAADLVEKLIESRSA